MRDTIEIPIACMKCRKYGHNITDCRKKEKDKKEKVKMKMKQDSVEIKTSCSTTLNDRIKNGKK